MDMERHFGRINSTNLPTITRYLPDNYRCFVFNSETYVYGADRFGWTFIDYVVPRLASGSFYVEAIAEHDFMNIFFQHIAGSRRME